MGGKMSEVKVEFCIVGDNFVPSEITKLLRICPTEVYCKDDKFLGGQEKNIPMIRKECCWCLETEYIDTIDVDAEIRKVYNILRDKTEVLKEIRNRFSVMYKFIIVIYLDNNPILSIKRDIVKFAAEIDADFDFDTYI